MNRNKWAVLVIIALVLSIGLTLALVRITGGNGPEPEETLKIVVAAEKLQLGQRLTERDLRLADWPKSARLEGSFTDIKDVLDRGVIVTLYPNEPVIEAKLAPKDAGAGLPVAIPDGMRAVSVKTNSVIGVAGFVLPGTRVDVIMTGKLEGRDTSASRIILENIQVLTAGTNIEQDANGKPQDVAVVTLLVSPEQAQELALAGHEHIQLALRNPLDSGEKDLTAVERASLFRPAKPAPAPAPAPKPAAKVVQPKPAPAPVAVAPPPKPEPVVVTVELISGNSKATLNFEEPVR